MRPFYDTDGVYRDRSGETYTDSNGNYHTTDEGRLDTHGNYHDYDSSAESSD